MDIHPETKQGPYVKALRHADQYQPEANYDPEERPRAQRAQKPMPFLRRITEEDRKKLSENGNSLHISIPELNARNQSVDVTHLHRLRDSSKNSTKHFKIRIMMTHNQSVLVSFPNQAQRTDAIPRMQRYQYSFEGSPMTSIVTKVEDEDALGPPKVDWALATGTGV